MPVEICCPSCDRKYSVGEKHIGRTVVCGHRECGTRFIAVVQATQREGPVEVEAFEFAEYREDPEGAEPATTNQFSVTACDETERSEEFFESSICTESCEKIPPNSGLPPTMGDAENESHSRVVMPPLPVLPEATAAVEGGQESTTDKTVAASEPSRAQFWGMAKRVLGDASTHVSNAGVVVTSRAASLGSSGVAKATEVGKQTYVAASTAIDATGAKEAIKATASIVSGKLDEVSGKRLVELLEQKLQIQDSYNDILATRLAEALGRIKVLEDQVEKLTSQSLVTEMSASENQR